VIESYDRLKQALAVEAEFIAKLGPKAVPEIDFADVRANGAFSPFLHPQAGACTDA
jgi:hypothetical protein